MYSFNSRTPIPQNVYKRLALYFNTLEVGTDQATFYGPKILQNVGIYITNKQLYSYTDEICFGSVCVCTQRTVRRVTFTFSSVHPIITVIVCGVLRQGRVVFC